MFGVVAVGAPDGRGIGAEIPRVFSLLRRRRVHRSTTSHPFSSKIGKVGMRTSGSRVAVGEDEDEALNGKGWLR